MKLCNCKPSSALILAAWHIARSPSSPDAFKSWWNAGQGEAWSQILAVNVIFLYDDPMGLSSSIACELHGKYSAEPQTCFKGSKRASTARLIWGTESSSTHQTILGDGDSPTAYSVVLVLLNLHSSFIVLSQFEKLLSHLS